VTFESGIIVIRSHDNGTINKDVLDTLNCGSDHCGLRTYQRNGLVHAGVTALDVESQRERKISDDRIEISSATEVGHLLKVCGDGEI